MSVSHYTEPPCITVNVSDPRIQRKTVRIRYSKQDTRDTNNNITYEGNPSDAQRVIPRTPPASRPAFFPKATENQKTENQKTETQETENEVTENQEGGGTSSGFIILNYTPDIELEIYPENETLIKTPHYYQSIILRKNSHKNELLSVAPSTPLPLGVFFQKNPVCDKNIQINPMTEGTLIQLFYDTIDGEWQIATKGAVGGHNRHYRTEYPGFRFQPQKTFREMFYDALTQMTVTAKERGEDDMEIEDDPCDLQYDPSKTYYHIPLSELPYIKTLNKSWCYSFIVSHPSNPMVNIAFFPTITLVAVCEIRPYIIPPAQPTLSGLLLGVISRSLFISTMSSVSHPKEIPGEYLAVSIPQHVFAETIPPEYRKIVRVQQSFDWTGESFEENTLNYVFTDDRTPGLMLTNIQTGERSILYNEAYRRTEELRGNHPNLQYQYFVLRSYERVDEFLARFPVFTDLFTHFYQQYCDLIFSVVWEYVQYYVENIRGVTLRHKYHIYKIHQILKKYIQDNQTPDITPQFVQHYFDRMTPGQLVYLVKP